MDETKQLAPGTKVRWKQMPASIAVIVSGSYNSYTIKFETDGPLKGQTLPNVSAKSLYEVTVLDEIMIEGNETPDPWFRKKKAETEITSVDDEARAFIEKERKAKGGQ